MRINILGTRGLPAQHGGFETCVSELAPYLVSHGHQVYVYCQGTGPAGLNRQATFGGARLIHMGRRGGALATVLFDLQSTWHAARHGGVALIFGYNTAIFALILRLFHRRVIINMDGIEWQRRKWGKLPKLWFWFNELAACALTHRMIADHPAIQHHLSRGHLRRVTKNKLVMIPYGAHPAERNARADLLPDELHGKSYACIVARAEPENTILEMVEAWSLHERGALLAVVGSYNWLDVYQSKVLAAASEEVVFLGPIYETEVVRAIRSNSLAYLYGHTVGGTSPTLVEAMACGTPIIAFQTVYSEWVAGTAGVYFRDSTELNGILSTLLTDTKTLGRLSANSRSRWAAEFTWERVLTQYNTILASEGDAL